MIEKKAYIIFDYFVEDYFRAIYMYDGYLFLLNEFGEESAFMPIDETQQKEVLKYQRYAVMGEDEGVVDWMKNEIRIVRGKLQ